MQGYTKLKKVGSGKFSTAYTATDDETGITILVKQIPKNSSNQSTVKREVKILKKMQDFCDKYIVCFIKFQEDNDNYYIFTEYYGNYTTLKEYLNRYRPSIYQLEVIFTNLLIGLKLIHDNGIVHRDIKPDNILIDPETLEVKYIDFGLSCLEEDLKCLEGLKGTPYYTSPELYKQEQDKRVRSIRGVSLRKEMLPYEAYEASDIWSLGLVLFNLIENYMPLWKFNDRSTLVNYLLGLMKHNSEILEIDNITTSNLQEVIRSMLKPRWKDRGNIDYLLNLLSA